MKKYIAVLCFCMFAALAANPAMAAKNDKATVQDTQDQAVYQKFLSDTAATRQELAGKRAEYQALMRGQNPDPAAAAKLSKEIFTLQEKMRAQAPQGYGPRGGIGNCPGFGGGYGAGCGVVGGGCGGGGGFGGRGRGMGL